MATFNNNVILSVLILLFTCVHFGWSLKLTLSQPDVITGQTKNLTLSCDARADSANYNLVTLLQLSKVEQGGAVTALVELINGGQKPIYLDSAFEFRTQTYGTLDLSQGVYMTVVVPDPQGSDAGDYRCSMSYLDKNNGLGVISADSTLKVLDLFSLKSELDKLKKDLADVKARNCSCTGSSGGKGNAVAFTARVFSQQNVVSFSGVLPFNLAEIDTHGGYNESSYTYTVQVDGLYAISLTIGGDNSGTNSSDFQADVTVNHVIKASMMVQHKQTSSLSVNLKLIKGQEVTVEAARSGSGSVRTHGFSSFSGVLLN